MWNPLEESKKCARIFCQARWIFQNVKDAEKRIANNAELWQVGAAKLYFETGKHAPTDIACVVVYEFK